MQEQQFQQRKHDGPFPDAPGYPGVSGKQPEQQKWINQRQQRNAPAAESLPIRWFTKPSSIRPTTQCARRNTFGSNPCRSAARNTQTTTNGLAKAEASPLSIQRVGRRMQMKADVASDQRELRHSTNRRSGLIRPSAFRAPGTPPAPGRIGE